jgi:NADPH:quinone reductase-like Zn-dependent oxidoreductase
VAATTPAADEQALAAAGLTGGTIMAAPVREVTAALADRAVAGTLKVDVTTVVPFEQATDGLAIIASGHARGKIVVKIGD